MHLHDVELYFNPMRIYFASRCCHRHTGRTSLGPPDSKVIGRAWISDADGTMVDERTVDIVAGSTEEIVLTIPRTKVQHGNLIACMRVEWPLYQTKHVIKFTLVEGDIVHPPKGKDY